MVRWGRRRGGRGACVREEPSGRVHEAVFGGSGWRVRVRTSWFFSVRVYDFSVCF